MQDNVASHMFSNNTCSLIMSMEHVWCMLLLLVLVYEVTCSYSNHPFLCNTSREQGSGGTYFWYMYTHKALMLVVRAGWDVNQWRVW